MSAKPLVGIVMGSASDTDTLKYCWETLKEFGVSFEVQILSAHRTPKDTCAWAENAQSAGIKIIVASAGMAAHLAGVVAAHTSLPVIGIPLDGGVLGGLDSMLSTLQMPKGTPVATVAVGKAGAINAALLAVRILALSDKTLQDKLLSFAEKQRKEAFEANKKLQATL